MVFTQKDNMRTSDYGLLLEKVYVRLNENGHNISLKIVYKII